VVGLRSKIEIQLILYITVEYLHEPEAILASSRVGWGPFPPNVEQPKIFDFHDVDADAYTVFPRIASLSHRHEFCPRNMASMACQTAS